MATGCHLLLTLLMTTIASAKAGNSFFDVCVVKCLAKFKTVA